jgi:hypothetical protein
MFVGDANMAEERCVMDLHLCYYGRSLALED